MSCRDCAYYDGYECRLTAEHIEYPDEQVVCSDYDGPSADDEDAA